MTTNMLSISNILTNTIGAGPPNAEPLAIKKRNQSSSTLIEGKPQTKARRDGKVGNTQVKHKNRLNDKPTGEFSHSFCKEITSEVLQKANNGRNVLKQNQIPDAVGQPSEFLPLIAQWSLKAGHGSNGIVKKVELKPGLEHAQLYNNLSTDKSLLRVVKTARLQNSKPIPIVNQKQIGLKEISPKTSQNPLSTKIPPNQDENANKIQIPEGRLPAVKGVVNKQNGEGFDLQPLVRAHYRITTANVRPEDVPISNTFESQQTHTLVGEGLKPQAVVANSGITSIGGKATIVSPFSASGSQKTLPFVIEEFTPQVFVKTHSRITSINEKNVSFSTSTASVSQKALPFFVEELAPKALVGAISELTNVIPKPAITGKSVVPIDRTAPLSNPNIPPVPDKASGIPFQAVTIIPEKSPFIEGNAVANKIVVSQPDHIQSGQLSGPLVDDMTEQGPNSSGNLDYEHLHRLQFQTSAGSFKGHNSSVSNKNADSDFEQIFSGSTATVYVEEQTSAFPEAVTTDNLPIKDLPNNVSASITKQVLESIQSSSSQQAGIQQITIRLHPPELGKIFIKFEEQENQLTGLVEVSKTQTRYEIEQALPQIIQNLAGCGIQIKRLEIMLTNQNEQQSYGDESLQDGLFQQHYDLPGWDNPDNPGNFGDNDIDIVRNNSSYQDGFEPQAQITDNSINILI